MKYFKIRFLEIKDINGIEPSYYLIQERIRWGIFFTEWEDIAPWSYITFMAETKELLLDKYLDEKESCKKYSHIIEYPGLVIHKNFKT